MINSKNLTVASFFFGLALLNSWSMLDPCSAQEPFSQDPFSEQIRKTDPLTAQQQLETFKVPDGLTVELIASEPQIQKPLNMAFDARGRLWVTTTSEYPYPAELGKGHDQIVILEDSDGDGNFENRTLFADDLNIPIGILPYGKGCIVFDIPNISYLADEDADGKYDSKKVLYGPFDYSRDTHGLNNSFRQGFDGWIYACHGFNNQSKVQGADGNVVQLNSGNTYRFRPDGSRIEHYSHGQVNPFGMTIDLWFRIFTADCHSKPLTQVVRSGYYPSFGAPSDGLGFAPSMMEHLHGSTAIAGVTFLEGEHWPENLRGHLVSGNVMTCRINRNLLQWNGSTAQAIEQPDLVETTDPWFRPVDIVTGPDGAIYIADFYNRIIGHYEVPLEHPGRDRNRGRIWRVRPTAATSGKMGADALVQLNQACFENNRTELKEQLERIETLQPVTSVQIMWQAARVEPNLLTVDHLQTLAESNSPLVVSHLMRLLSETVPNDDEAEESVANGQRIAVLPADRSQICRWILSGLKHQDAAVRLAAVDAAGRLVDPQFMIPLTQLAAQVDDPMLAYSAKIALKHHLEVPQPSQAMSFARSEKIWNWVRSPDRSEAEQTVIGQVALAVNQPNAASFVLSRLTTLKQSEQFPAYVAYLTQNLPPSEIEQLVNVLDPAISRSKQEVISLLGSLSEGVKRSGAPMPVSLQQWAGKVATELLKEADANSENWSSFTLEGNAEPLPTKDPWKQQFRNTSDGKPHLLISSILRGEDRVGTLKSRQFLLGKKFSFLLAGHRGFPEDAAHDLNKVVLKLASNGATIHQSFPPRNDVAQSIVWDTQQWMGQDAIIEIIDGDTNDAYAWIAAGDFTIEDSDGKQNWIDIPNLLPAERLEQLELIQSLAEQFTLGSTLLSQLNSADSNDMSLRYALARTAIKLRFSRQNFLSDLATKLGSSRLDNVSFQNWLTFIETWTSKSFQDQKQLLENAAAASTSAEQQILLEAAISDEKVFQWILTLAESGKINANLLANAAVKQSIELKQASSLPVVQKLVANLPPVDAVWKKTVERRKLQFESAIAALQRNGKVSISDEMQVPNQDSGSELRDANQWLALGKQTFTKSCAVCHQIAGEGQVVGPQLDGIGGRGLNRVLEDVLLPNENVDHAFRSQLFQLTDGRLLIGLVKDRTDKAISIVNAEGKPSTIDVDEVDAERQSPLSLMPEDIARNLPAENMFGLIQFLLAQKNKTTE